MIGFFTKEEVGGTDKTVSGCDECGLYKEVNSPKMTYHGKGKRKLLLLGEGPGYNEDLENDQFVGQTGQLLESKLLNNGIEMNEDCYKINAVNCRPTNEKGNNRTPEMKEIRCCHPRVMKVIEELKPDFIFLLGEKAVSSFYFGRGYETGIGIWRKLCIPDKRANAWIIPLYHPSMLLHNKDEGLENLFDRDLKWAVSCLNKEPPVFEEWEKLIRIISTEEETNLLLDDILNGCSKVVDYDYETNCLDSRKRGAKIISCAVSIESGTYSFAFREGVKEKWIEVLQDENIWKSAQNTKFEEGWNRNVLGTECKGWIHDTMNTAHLIEAGRRKFCSLDFQAYIHFGVEGYDNEINQYKNSVDKNGFNKMEEAPLDKLLLYGGMDALIERKLREKQEKMINRNLWLRKINTLFHQGNLAYMDVESAGIPIDKKYYESEQKRLDKEMNDLFLEMKQSKEAKKFKKEIGRELGIEIRNDKIWVSDKDLRTLVYDVLGKKVIKETAKKRQASVDEETLIQHDIPLTNDLLAFRKLRKLSNTYIAQYTRECIRGKVNPNVNLHIARTGRPSCDHPNLYNAPKKDENAMKIIRRGIIPSKGNKLLEGDYGSLEVRILACYSHDPVLVDYINDPSTDMHRDVAAEIFFLDSKDVTTKLRFISKSGYVFPEFYGSWYKQVADNLWSDIDGLCLEDGTLVDDHLRDNGIKDYKDFEAHVRSVEKWFWDRFGVVREWQEKEIQFYNRNGYVESFLGFRRGGYLKKNKILNTSVQGTAYHCILWDLIQLNDWRKKEKLESVTNNQIYDSIMFDMVPTEQEIIMEKMEKVMTEDIREHWDWIIVSLVVEFEQSEIDGNWAEMEEIK